MKIIIDIKTDNAAFEDYGFETELNAILCKASVQITGAGMRDGNLRDSNGNTVGKFKVILFGDDIRVNREIKQLNELDMIRLFRQALI